jgi:chromosomal replication initiation ATPase DnaA
MTIKAMLEKLNERDLLRPLAAICKTHKATLEEVLSGQRYRHIVRARRACAVHLVKEEGLSHTSAASLLDLDHTTVSSAVRAADNAGHPAKEEP